MSIIGDARQRKVGYKPGSGARDVKEGKKEAPKILDLQLLKDYIPKVLDHMRPEMKPAYDRYRKHTYLWEVPIHHLLGKVDEPTWVYMIETQAAWIMDSWQSIQANGRWQVYDWEITTETRDHRTRRTIGQNHDGSPEAMDIIEQFEYLVVGVRIVDVNGNDDLQYDMGRPTNRKEQRVQQSGVSDKRISEQEKQLDEQKQQIFKLQGDLNKQNELMTALLTELQSLKSAPKKRAPRK